MAKKKSEVWYKEGLRFECSQCGDCCTGAPGFVWFNKKEGAQIAESLGISIEDFYAKYARKIGIRYSLKEFSNGDCVFFDPDNRNCKIYHHRPRQCKTWPFWGSNLKTPEDWERTCEECPGSGKGKLYSLEHIEKQRAAVRV